VTFAPRRLVPPGDIDHSEHGPGEDRMLEFLGRGVADTGAAFAGLSTSLGDRLGLHRAMAGTGPVSPARLAERTGLVERYLPAAMAQHGPHALGNHAGEAVLRELAAEAGLRGWTLAAQTPTNRGYAVTR
jgi:hypothetical protein